MAPSACLVSKVLKLKQSLSSKSFWEPIHKITIQYGLIRAIKLHNSFFLTLGYRIQMHVSTIPGNFNKLLTSKTTKASINEKIFMINKTQWGKFQCFSATAFPHSNFDISLILFHWLRGNFCNLNSTWQCFLDIKNYRFSTTETNLKSLYIFRCSPHQ